MTTAKRTRILFVDDNPNLLSAVRRTLRGQAELVIAESASDALNTLESDPGIAMVISDQKMPGMKGIEFLAQVAQRWPHVTRVMQTGNADQETAINAISEARVFRFLRKPYEPADLLQVIHDGLAENDIRDAERALLETTLAASVKLLTEMLALMRPELYAQSSRVHELAKALSVKLKLAQPWELSLAALLYPLGLATLPSYVLAKRAHGTRLTESENKALAESGIAAGDLVGRIPKLDGVATYLRYCRKGHDGSGLPNDDGKQATLSHAIHLLPLLIDIVELADRRNISLQDAAVALCDYPGRYHEGFLLAAIEWLKANETRTDGAKPAVQELGPDAIKVGDVLVNDLYDENGELLLPGGSRLNELSLKRVKILFAHRANPRHIAVTRAA